MRARTPLLTYLKAAFLWHWNVMACGAALIFSVLSRQPDVFLPLFTAVEIAYLGLLSTNPRFQKAVDVRNKVLPSPASQSELIGRIRSALKSEVWARFENLRARCTKLNELARQFRGPGLPNEPALADIQLSSLDKLLWMFLKLLYSQDALDAFLRATDRQGLVRDIAANEKALQEAKARERGEKLARALEDKLATLHQRLDNYDRARENRELLAVELDRIEQKVNAIGEMAMSARDASDISAQVDGIAAGVSATEEAIRGLDVAPALQREEAPRFLTEQN